MSLEDFQLLHNEAIDKSIIKRVFSINLSSTSNKFKRF